MPLRRNPLGMLDDGPVHVADPHGPVRTRADHDGTEPVVRGSQELRGRFAFAAAAAERHSLSRQDLAVHQVVDGFADKRIARIEPDALKKDLTDLMTDSQD